MEAIKYINLLLQNRHAYLVGNIGLCEQELADALAQLTGFDFEQEFSIQYQPSDGLCVLFNDLNEDSINELDNASASDIYKANLTTNKTDTLLPLDDFINYVKQGKTKYEILEHFYL